MNDDATTPRLGFWLMSASLTACEVAALAGFDVVVLDMEHGVHNPRDADGFIVFCKARGLGGLQPRRVGRTRAHPGGA